MHHTKDKPKIDLKPSRPKLKRIATSVETQIVVENSSHNTISAAFEKLSIVRNPFNCLPLEMYLS